MSKDFGGSKQITVARQGKFNVRSNVTFFTRHSSRQKAKNNEQASAKLPYRATHSPPQLLAVSLSRDTSFTGTLTLINHASTTISRTFSKPPTQSPGEPFTPEKTSTSDADKQRPFKVTEAPLKRLPDPCWSHAIHPLRTVLPSQTHSLRQAFG